MNYLRSGEICERLKITPMTLKRWKDSNVIQYKQITSKKILYDIDSVLDLNQNKNSRKNVIYARVSNTKQKNDLNHQIELIKKFMISNGIKPDIIFSEVASGLNEHRLQFNKMLEMIFHREIDTIYISYKDRLTRFGFDYFSNIFNFFNTKILVIDENENIEKTFQEELSNDIISVVHHFSMKLYSNRRKKLKEIEKSLQSNI